jgi:hypothetical protein
VQPLDPQSRRRERHVFETKEGATCDEPIIVFFDDEGKERFRMFPFIPWPHGDFMEFI